MSDDEYTPVPDVAELIEEANAFLDSWDRRGSWSSDSPVGMVMRLVGALETVRREERERCDPGKDERLARYMALVTPLGYATAVHVIEAMNRLIDVEHRAEEIAERARQEEREKAAQIAENVPTRGFDEYADGWDDAADTIATHIREQGR